MAGRIVLFGATGYTGDLTARALVERGVQPVLAARNEARIKALAAELGELAEGAAGGHMAAEAGPSGPLPWAVADVERPDSVHALVERGDVLISTVGPFARWGQPALEAAIGAGAHYLDSTGEGSFIREVFERRDAEARAAGCGLLTAFGYDWVPGNLAGALALRDAGEAAVRVEIGYFNPGSGADAMSGGTRASAASVMLAPGHAFHEGRIVEQRSARRGRTFELRPGKKARGVSVSTSEPFALPRVHPGLRDVEVFLGWFGQASEPLRAASAMLDPLLQIPGARDTVQDLFGKLVKGSTGGPDAAARAGSRSIVFAEAYDAAGTRLAEVRLEGGNAYELTASFLAWGAQTAAAGGLQGTGALGPVDGFGLEALERGCAEVGIARV